MRVLVTGGAGFIGSHTADALIDRGHSVRILDSLEKPVHTAGKPAYLHPEVEFVLGDVTRHEDVLAALDGVDAVVHLAAYQDYLPDFSKFFRVNAAGTALLYEIIVEKKLPVRERSSWRPRRPCTARGGTGVPTDESCIRPFAAKIGCAPDVSRSRVRMARATPLGSRPTSRS
jgi:NAD(P)-dependent dehydrogenase (short-subunit alcohol dehydrogenase family)